MRASLVHPTTLGWLTMFILLMRTGWMEDGCGGVEARYRNKDEPTPYG